MKPPKPDPATIERREFLARMAIIGGSAAAVASPAAAAVVPQIDPRLSSAAQTEALQRGIAAAIRSGASEITIPAGTYRVRDGVLSSGAPRQGVTLRGAGREATTLLLESDGGRQSWFYDNRRGHLSDRNTYIGIRFQGQDKAFCNGFRQNDSGPGSEKRNTFIDCAFSDLGDVLSTTGTTNADENTYIACEFNRCNTLLRLNNAQSMGHHYIGCRGTQFRRDIVVIERGGGGEFAWIGGSIIHEPNEGRDHYWVKANGSVNTGYQTGQFLWSKLRCENRGVNSKLVHWLAEVNAARIVFDDCNLATAVGHGGRGTGGSSPGIVRPNTVHIGGGKFVHFKGCMLPQTAAAGINDQYGYRVTHLDARSTDGNPGTIRFENCTGPRNMRDLCSITNSYGRIICEGHMTAETVGPADRRAMDFDMGWANALPGANTTASKIVSLKTNLWPLGDGSHERTLILPAGALLRRVSIYKPAQGSSATPVQYRIGSHDKATVYGESALSRADGEHRFDVSLNIPAFRSTTSLRMWATGGTLAQSGGYAIVEYI